MKEDLLLEVLLEVGMGTRHAMSLLCQDALEELADRNPDLRATMYRMAQDRTKTLINLAKRRTTDRAANRFGETCNEFLAIFEDQPAAAGPAKREEGVDEMLDPFRGAERG